MTAIKDVAEAFAMGRMKKNKTAFTDGQTYTLHSTDIVHKVPGGVELNWGGWYTPTTANHMNAVLAALGISRGVSYSAARKQQIDTEFYPL